MYPADLKYSKDHEWARIEGKRAVIGISQFAAEQLGDVVYVDYTSKVGQAIAQFEAFGTVESVKAANELFSPLAGRVVAVNSNLSDHPELVNSAPYDQGWMIELELADDSGQDRLLSAKEYENGLDN